MNPYLATGVMLQETGCQWTCSYLTRVCNNVVVTKVNQVVTEEVIENLILLKKELNLQLIS